MSELPETYVPGFHDENEIRKMTYTKFGNTGMSVSKLSLGTAGFSWLYGHYSLEECKAIVLEALKKGINYIDTAPWYGQGVSEEILGRCLEGIPRKAYYIASKVARYEREPRLMFDFTAKKTRESVDASLKRLKLDYVDLIQVHDMDFAPSIKIVLEETLPTLKEAVEQGKARFIGVTGYHVNVLADCVKQSTVRIDSILTYARLSLLDTYLKEFIPFFNSKNVAVINAAPHCLGLLSSVGPQDWNPAHQDTKDICTEAREYCKKHGVEIGKLALYYALNEDGPCTILVGINSPQLVNVNLDVFYNGLTQKETEVYNHVRNNILSKLTRGHWNQVEINRYLESLKA